MATTTNFGWETPDDTDLVKDGAAAIRTLGGAIDTSLVDLKGGTTGQVLSKASNTDMDFSWVASTAGDIEGVTAGAGLSGGGTSGTVTLSLNSQVAGKNAAINGAFDIWQRGTSVAVGAVASAYTADRWWAGRAGSVAGTTVSRQTTSDTTNLPEIQYAARVQRDSGNTSTAIIYFRQPIENFNSTPYINKTVALSFYARAGANYSAASSTLTSTLISGTGTDQTGTSITGEANVATAGNTLTTTWQRFTITGTVASTAKQLFVSFQYTPVGTAGANDWFEVTGVQVELGSSATPFSRAGGTIQGELAACQRYYQVIGGTTNSFPLLGGYISNGEVLRVPMPFPVQMRTAPTITKNGTWNAVGIGQPSASYINTQGFSIQATGTANGFYLHPDSTDDSFTISAEL